MGYANTDKVIRYRPAAWIAADETLDTKLAPRTWLAFDRIYQICPPQCRYAVLICDGEIVRVADIYATNVNGQDLKPVWIDQVFKSIEHAIATMRVTYNRKEPKQ